VREHLTQRSGVLADNKQNRNCGTKLAREDVTIQHGGLKMASMKLVSEGHETLRPPVDCSCGCDCGVCAGCSCAGPESLMSSRTGGQITMATQAGGAWTGGGGAQQQII